MRDGAFSSRLMVGWEHRSRPLTGARPTASLNSGSARNASQSSATSYPHPRSDRRWTPQQPHRRTAPLELQARVNLKSRCSARIAYPLSEGGASATLTLYRLRQQTVEPVFGVIKAVLGFTRFSLRGLDKVAGEWDLVALAYNCKRLHKLTLATAS